MKKTLNRSPMIKSYSPKETGGNLPSSRPGQGPGFTERAQYDSLTQQRKTADEGSCDAVK